VYPEEGTAMASRLKVRIVLNKGRHGVPLDKLPKILAEIREFLHDLSTDLGIEDDSGWQGVDFRNGSLDFAAVKNSLVDDAKYLTFQQSARNVILNQPDDRISRRTRSQYAKIATPIDADEVVDIGLPQEQAGVVQPGEEEQFQWYELTKQAAEQIQALAQAKVKALASIQGIIHSVFIENADPHFQLRELSSQSLIKCTYAENKYNELAEALKQRMAVVHVYGLSTTDMLARKIEQMDVYRIDVSPSLAKDFLDRFSGCAAGLIDDGEMQAHIDQSRNRGN
jgi:hypothetical protein